MWYFSIASNCPDLWLLCSLTMMYLLYGRRRISLIVSPKFRLVLFMYRLVDFTCWSTPLARSPISLCLRFGHVVLLAFESITVSSSHLADLSSLAVVGSHCWFDVFYGLVLCYDIFLDNLCLYTSLGASSIPCLIEVWTWLLSSVGVIIVVSWCGQRDVGMFRLGGIFWHRDYFAFATPLPLVKCWSFSLSMSYHGLLVVVPWCGKCDVG